MIIRGGQVFILEDDIAQNLSITGSTVIVDLSDGSTISEREEYLANRLGVGSEVRDCTIRTLSKWANERAAESISRSKSDVHLKAAPIMQRIRKFLHLGVAS